MKWYYTVRGGHTHIRVFMNGAKCGDLCFRNEEFREILRLASHEPLFEAIEEKDLNEKDASVSTGIEATKPMK